MTDANPTSFQTADLTAPSIRRIDWSVARLPTATIGPDASRGLIVVFGSLLMAFAGMGLGAWMALPFGN